MEAIILAGGKGTRLAPYTTVLPKPLMPIDNMPILEIVIRQLSFYGFKKITLAVGYLAELLMAFCGNGERFGVEITYSKEEKPLGTAGPIGLIKKPTEPFIVMNGDVLTTLNFKDFLDYHLEKKSLTTIATYKRDAKIDLGVIEADQSGFVNGYVEKPVFHYLVSTGIYLFEPDVMDYIFPGEYLDLPNLILKLIKANKRVVSYNFTGQWLDIGRHDDYQNAVEVFLNNKNEFIPS